MIGIKMVVIDGCGRFGQSNDDHLEIDNNATDFFKLDITRAQKSTYKIQKRKAPKTASL
jgi:hypothetical protein